MQNKKFRIECRKSVRLGPLIYFQICTNCIEVTTQGTQEERRREQIRVQSNTSCCWANTAPSTCTPHAVTVLQCSQWQQPHSSLSRSTALILTLPMHPRNLVLLKPWRWQETNISFHGQTSWRSWVTCPLWLVTYYLLPILAMCASYWRQDGPEDCDGDWALWIIINSRASFLNLCWPTLCGGHCITWTLNCTMECNYIHL